MGAQISLQVPTFTPFGYMLRLWSKSIGDFFEELQSCFLQQLHHFPFLTAVHKGCDFSTSSPTLVFCLFNYSHSFVVKWYLLCTGLVPHE